MPAAGRLCGYADSPACPTQSRPVVQLSINVQKPPDYHLGLGARLAKPRERGVLVLGRGIARGAP